MSLAQPRMERLGIDAVVDDVEPLLRRTEPRPDFVPHQARVADHRAQPRAREQPPFSGEDVAVIGIEREPQPAKRAKSGAPVLEPLGVHAVAGPVDIAAVDALMRLHELKRPAGDLAAHGAGETPVAPKAADVKRIAADQASGVADPFAREHGYRYTLPAERAECALDEALGTPVGVVALPNQGETHSRYFRASSSRSHRMRTPSSTCGPCP